MNRVLRRPMFRIGGSAGTGITSGLDRKGYKDGTDEYDRALKTTSRFMADIDKFREYQKKMRPKYKNAKKKYDAERYARKKAERQGEGTLEGFLR